MTDPILIGMVALSGISVGLAYTLHQLTNVRTAAEEAAAYAERNGDEYSFEVGGEE